MQIDDILTLARAGFTAEQISAMANRTEEKPAAEPPKKEPPATFQKEEKPAAEPPKEKPPATFQKEEGKPAGPDLAALAEEVKALRTQMQAKAIRENTMPDKPSVDDILAGILS